MTHDLLYPTYGVCSAVVAMDTAVGQKAVRTLSECEADQNKRRKKVSVWVHDKGGERFIVHCEPARTLL